MVERELPKLEVAGSRPVVRFRSAYSAPHVRSGLLFPLYILVGVLVAAGIIGSDGSYFSGLSNLEELVELVLAILLWPLVLLDVNVNIGDINIGGGDSGGGGSGAK